MNSFYAPLKISRYEENYHVPRYRRSDHRNVQPGLESRINAILPDLPAQPYIFRFWDDAGLCRTVKVVKQ